MLQISDDATRPRAHAQPSRSAQRVQRRAVPLVRRRAGRGGRARRHCVRRHHRNRSRLLGRTGPRRDGPPGPDAKASQFGDEGPGFPHFLDTLAAFPKPMIAAVNGIGVGIGMTMLLARRPRADQRDRAPARAVRAARRRARSRGQLVDADRDGQSARRREALHRRLDLGRGSSRVRPRVAGGRTGGTDARDPRPRAPHRQDAGRLARRIEAARRRRAHRCNPRRREHARTTPSDR